MQPNLTREFRKGKVTPNQVFEKSVCWYDFESDIRGELNGPRPVIIIGRDPSKRMLEKLDIQVIPTSTAPSYSPEDDIPVEIIGRSASALVGKITTINPNRLRDFSGSVSAKDFRAVKAGLLRRFEPADPNPVGKASHLRPRHVLSIPTDRAPEGRRYVVLDNRRNPYHLDQPQFMPLPTRDDLSDPNCRIRSFSALRVRHIAPIGRLDERGFDQLRVWAGHRLALPALSALQSSA